MKILKPTNESPEPADPNNFTGKATLVRIDGACDDPKVNVYRVEFQPRARTAWHTHSGPQLLLVIEGRCRVQSRGEPIKEVSAGCAILIGPDEKHWHGATPDEPMTHLALNINATTTWLQKVSDSQYEGHP